MITIKAEYTTTEERMRFFAQSKGWSGEIENPDYNPQVDGSTKMIPNTVESLKEFLTNFGNKLLIDQLSHPAILHAMKEINEQKMATVENIKTNIASGLNVIVE